MKRHVLIVLALSLLAGSPAAGQEALALTEAAGDTALSPPQPTLLEQLEDLQKSRQWVMITTSWGEKIVCQISSAKSGDEILITYPQGNQRYFHLSHVVSVKSMVSPSPGDLKPPTLSYRGYSFPASGARVRVSAPQQGRQTGTLLEVNPDTLLIIAEGRSVPLGIPLASVTRLEIHRGQKSEPLKGAVFGLAMGAGIGAAIAMVVGNTIGDCDPGVDDDCSPGLQRKATIAWGVPLGVLGALVGAGIGSSMGVDQWERVPLEQVRLGVAPQRHGGVRLVASFTF